VRFVRFLLGLFLDLKERGDTLCGHHIATHVRDLLMGDEDGGGPCA